MLSWARLLSIDIPMWWKLVQDFNTHRELCFIGSGEGTSNDSEITQLCRSSVITGTLSFNDRHGCDFVFGIKTAQAKQSTIYSISNLNDIWQISLHEC